MPPAFSASWSSMVHPDTDRRVGVEPPPSCVDPTTLQISKRGIEDANCAVIQEVVRFIRARNNEIVATVTVEIAGPRCPSKSVHHVGSLQHQRRISGREAPARHWPRKNH